MENIIDELKNIGLTKNEAKIYLASLELGKASVLELSKLADIKRPTAYLTLYGLQEKGIVKEIKQNGKSKYIAENPKIVINRQKRKIKYLEEFLPQLMGIAAKGEEKPKIKFYEGKDGIVNIYEDNLLEPKESELLAFTSAQDLYNILGDYMHQHIKRRVKRKIHARTIVTNYENFPEHFYHAKTELRSMRAIESRDFLFKGEINIYGNKVSIISLKKEIIGLIVESNQVANNMRAIFELAWRGAKDFDQSPTI